ncbi:MAG: hypothetical protein L0Y56_07090 [Nitrospira sp.]|nr:hypothetical protein [Nitrospira sp.]
MGQNSAVEFVVGLGIAFALLLPFTLIFIFSRISGWNELAEKYPVRRPGPYPRKWLGYGVFRGWIGYNGGMVISSDHQGLYLSAMPIILSFCHKPIFIPWSEIREIRKRSRWFGSGYEIHTLRAPHVDFLLRPGTFNFVKDRATSAGVPGDYC